MFTSKFLAECFMALIGGALGASISGLGGFVLLGLAGVVGFAYMLITGENIWIMAGALGIILKPSVCFVGGLTATAFTRKKTLIKCGKDIGRSLLEFHRGDLILVGSAAGLVGYLVNTLYDSSFLSGKLDTTALTVVTVPLVMKYIWGLTRTSDCAASSHAVPSPYRFFEKLSSTKGKVGLSVLTGMVTVLITWALSLNPNTAPMAGVFVFFVSACSLYFVFMGIPIPATHHFSGPAGAVTMYLIGLNSIANKDLMFFILLIFWGITAAVIGMTTGDFMGRLLFTEGDIHIDPPAMGIMITTALFLGILPFTGIYRLPALSQIAFCIIGSIAVSVIKLQSEKKKQEAC